MSDSTFQNIRFAGLSAVCEAVEGHTVGDIGFIRRTVSETTLYFDESVSFLINLGVTKVAGARILKGKYFPKKCESRDEMRRFFRELILHESKRFPKLLEFLACFATVLGRLSFTPTHLQKAYFGDVRDILHDLAFITYDSSRSSYFVPDEMIELYLSAIESRQMTPRQLKSKLKSQESVGFDAELAVMDYEYSRLRPFGIKKAEISHVALSNVAAGYDIRSYDCSEGSSMSRIPRFIEVKSVSDDEYSFYWSRSEIETARRLGHLYCLYLIPRLSGGHGFDTSRVLIIRDPYLNVYLKDAEWPRQVETFFFDGKA